MIAATARSYWRELVIGVLLLALVGLSATTCQYRKKGVSAKSQQTIDSLAATRPAFDSAQSQSRVDELAHVTAAARMEAAVAKLTKSAAQDRQTADRLAAAALTAGTDAAQWRVAYEARTDEAVTLRAALDTANARADAERMARLEADRRAARDSARTVALQNLALGLERDANRAANCRIARIIPCITRTQAFVGGAILGGAATYAAVNR